MVAFDTLVGNDTSLAVEDVLGGKLILAKILLISFVNSVSSDRSDVPFTFDTHAAMERKLKINTR